MPMLKPLLMALLFVTALALPVKAEIRVTDIAGRQVVLAESGGAKTYHGSGGIVPLRAV